MDRGGSERKYRQQNDKSPEYVQKTEVSGIDSKN